MTDASVAYTFNILVVFADGSGTINIEAVLVRALGSKTFSCESDCPRMPQSNIFA
jgi:hypothetical protein